MPTGASVLNSWHIHRHTPREDPGNTGERSDPLANHILEPQRAAANGETAELFKIFMNMYQATNEIDYLHNAISLAEELSLSDGGILPVLSGLLQLRDYLTVVDDWHKRVNGQRGGLQNEASNKLSDSPQTLRGVIETNTLYTAFKKTDNISHLEDLIQIFEKTILSTPLGPSRQSGLVLLTYLLEEKYDMTKNFKDLEKLIEQTQLAVALTPSNHPERKRLVEIQDKNLARRFLQSGNPQDLERFLKRSVKAVAATPLDHPGRGSQLLTLSVIYFSRYERSGDLLDLEQSIRWAEEAVAATPLNHPNRAERLRNLSNYISNRYERLGDLQDLEMSIKWAEEAVAATPLDHPDRAAWLGNLSQRISSRYERFEDLQDLEISIKWAEEAVAATPLDHPDRAVWLGNLSKRISSRYKRFEDLQDLEISIKWAEETVAATPLDHPDRAAWLGNLSQRISSRYERLGELQDLEQSIKWAEEVVAATPLDHPDRAGRLNNLGTLIGSRYERLGGLQDLGVSIKWAEEAVAATPLDHPNHAAWLSNLSNRIHSRYERLGDLQDLEQSIKWAEEVVAATPLDHFIRADRLFYLAITLKGRYLQTESTQDFYYILHNLHESWHLHVSAPTIRILAARHAGLFLASKNMWQESTYFLGDAVKMLPKLSPRSLGRVDQEHHLSKFTRLAALAVSTAFQAGEGAAFCLRLLEHGRGVIMGLTMDCRNDISELGSSHPEIFDKFHRLRIEIDSPPLIREGQDSGPAYEQERRRRRQAVEELEQTLARIRELPGFEGFQLPPHSNKLMEMAVEGPIVIFNSTSLRSDAITVTHSAIRSIALPKLHYESVEKHMSTIAKIVRGGRSTYLERNKIMGEILLWLWDVAVEPVFNALQLNVVANDEGHDLPRIWWIGVGLLTTAPFHAAGDHTPGSTRNTISRAISSYIPTIKALSYARQKKLELLSETHPHLLLVTMPTTPKSLESRKAPGSLPNAAREAEKIVGIVKRKAITATLLDRPSTSQVLKELPLCHAVHFACHGVSDDQSPSNSHLLLRKDDGTELGVLDKLTVGDISNTNLEHAQIAYLSACCTAQNASKSLVDESIYIASGFQLASFSHVLATQWVSNDGACLQVAGDFCESLFSSQNSESEQGHRKVSVAFHSAVKKLRAKNLNQPIKWACYIHTGA